MTRNQKIALGCGGAGCLGIIVLIVLGVVLSAAGYLSLPGSTNRNYNFNVNNSNRNSNFNSNFNRNSNSNSSSSSSSSLSSDERHRLFQAAGMTKDAELIQRVLTKIGLGTGTGADQEEFVREHFAWALNNQEFLESINSPEKARAYVEEHIDD